MNNERTLLAKARQSTKDEQAARRKQQRERLSAFWGDCYDVLENFARECIADSYESDGKVSDCETALQNVRKKLRRCKAQTREGFLAWAIKQIAKEPHFHLVSDAVNRFDLDISNYIADAALRLARYADFPEHYKDGSLFRVKMGTRSDGVPIVWTVPERYWEFVKKLWPVSLKQRANGAYFITKQISGATIPAHRLLFNCEPTDTIRSTSDNFLDWTSLCVRPLNQSGLYDGRNTSWNRDAERPRTVQEEFEHRFTPLPEIETVEDERAPGPRYSTPANADLAAKAMCFGKVGPVGWINPITPAERDCYAPERYQHMSARSRAAQALDRLGL